MRALAVEGLGAALREMELPTPQPGPGEVLIRVQSRGGHVRGKIVLTI